MEGTWAYANGLTPEQGEEWDKRLRVRGLIPYVQWPVLCAYCGTLWPELFHVSDDEWARIIQPDMRDKVVCRGCYDRIKRLIDLNPECGRPIHTSETEEDRKSVV